MYLKKLDSPEIHADIDLGLHIADLLGWNVDERNVKLTLWNDATFQVQVHSYSMNFGLSAGDCRVCHKPVRVVTSLCLTSSQYNLANVLEGLCLTCFKYRLCEEKRNGINKENGVLSPPPFPTAFLLLHSIMQLEKEGNRAEDNHFN